MNCFYCKKSESESPLSGAVFVKMDKKLESLKSAHVHFWKTNNEPTIYEPGDIYDGNCQSEVGGNIAIHRRVVGKGTRYANTITLVDSIETELQIEVLRCAACESAVKKSVHKMLAIAIGCAGVVGGVIAFGVEGMTGSAALLWLFLWLIFSVLAFFLVKMQRESSSQLSKHPDVRAALREKFNLRSVDDGAFSRDMAGPPKRQYFD